MGIDAEVEIRERNDSPVRARNLIVARIMEHIELQ